MARYIVRRLLLAALTIFLVGTVSFFMIRVAPGDVLLAKLQGGGRITPADLERGRAELGLDKPAIEQYWHFLKDAVQGDLGNSLITSSESTVSQVGNTFPKTLEILILSTLITLIIAIPAGVLSAVRQDSALDFFVRIFATLGLAVPTFFLGTVMVVYGAIWFGVAPISDQPGFFEDPTANLKAFLAPALVIGFAEAAVTMRITRSTVLEMLRQDFVRTARSKGIRERTVIARHVMKNALVPIVTVFGNQFAFLLGGTVVVETIFNINGMGALTLRSINQRDYTQVMTNTLFLGGAVVLVNLLVDISYAWMDPRIRYG
jgi:peptide/nickel transport system permease protein